MNDRAVFRIAAALTAGGLSWLAACSWRGLVEDPVSFSGPALAVMALIAVTGAAGRSLRIRWFGVLPAQLVVLVVWLHHHEHVGGPLGGWVPTPTGIRAVVERVGDGAAAINKYAAPVGTDHSEAVVYLVVVAALLGLSVDVIGCGLRRPDWVGLPVVIALTIPISVLDGSLAGAIYVGVGLLFVLLLALVEADRALLWGNDPRGSVSKDDAPVRLGVIGAPALAIGASALAVAAAIALVVPVSGGLFDETGGSGGGSGTAGTDGEVTLINPFLNLKRDLVQPEKVTLLRGSTDAADPSYLRIAVLDEFDGKSWKPAPRDLGDDHVADGALPDPEGLDADAPGADTVWELETTQDFKTSWLPTPYPTRDIAIDDGDWRYDPVTLDIANTDKVLPRQISYRLNAFAPTIDGKRLAAAQAAPPEVQARMTSVPGLRSRITQIAESVTATGDSTYEKVVLLQDWFRRDGGFEYSLDTRPGDGMDQLERFITTDKSGYCEQFSAAMAVMARSLGIPARVVVGFLDPEKSGPGRYTWSSDALHAWPEIYFRGYGWVRFEPTPSSRTGNAPPWTGQRNERPTPSVPSATPTQRRPQPTPSKAPGTTTSTSPTATDQGHSFPLFLVGALLVLLVASFPALLRHRQRARRLSAPGDPRVAVERLWSELRATAVDLGLTWPAGRSARMVAETLRGHVVLADGRPTDADTDGLELLVRVVEQARYAERFDLDDADRQQASDAVRRWAALLTDTVKPSRARRARVLPRSVFTRNDDQLGGGETSQHPDLTEVR